MTTRSRNQEDLGRIRLLMEQAAEGLFREPNWGTLMIEQPEVWGAQELSSREVTMRIVAKTVPMRQWEVARELRSRVKAALDEAGVAPACRTPSWSPRRRAGSRFPWHPARPAPLPGKRQCGWGPA